jgi:hypothetical protein
VRRWVPASRFAALLASAASNAYWLHLRARAPKDSTARTGRDARLAAHLGRLFGGIWSPLSVLRPPTLSSRGPADLALGFPELSIGGLWGYSTLALPGMNRRDTRTCDEPGP